MAALDPLGEPAVLVYDGAGHIAGAASLLMCLKEESRSSAVLPGPGFREGFTVVDTAVCWTHVLQLFVLDVGVRLGLRG